MSERRAEPVSPVLALGLGNVLLRDDGIGIELLARLRSEPLPGVEYLDGGTLGIALAGHLSGRRAVLILDAARLGATPGTIHHLSDGRSTRPRPAGTAHEAGADDLLAVAALLGDLPERTEVLAVEPAELGVGIGLSTPVVQALPAALHAAQSLLAGMLRDSAKEATCTS